MTRLDDLLEIRKRNSFAELLANCPDKLAKSSLKSHSLLTPIMVEALDIFGARYWLNINDYIQYNIFMRGFYDPTVAILAGELWPSSDQHYCLDIGAHVGSTFLPLAKKGWHCIAVEAFPKTFATLYNNCSLNEVGARLYHRAVMCSQSRCGDWVAISEITGNSGCNSVKAEAIAMSTQSYSAYTSNELARTISIDEVVACCNGIQPSLLKLDVEGCELELLQDIVTVSCLSHTVLVCEFIPQFCDKLAFEHLVRQFYYPLSVDYSYIRHDNTIQIRLELYPATFEKSGNMLLLPKACTNTNLVSRLSALARMGSILKQFKLPPLI